MEIADWRKKIDEIDGKLVALLGERARVAEEIGRLKAKANLPIVEPERAQAVFDRIEQLNPGMLPTGGLTRIYQGIMEVMLEIQRRQR
jgi:chorismate mutase / prephenate dehydratase